MPTTTTLELACGVIATGFSQRPDRAFGGYILFARNVESVEAARELSDALRAQAQPAPFVAIDQEGGRVTRLRSGVEPVPSMMAVGATANEQLAGYAGATLAHDLRRIGCTLDFAPVLDLALDPRNTVIGTRAFGTTTELVTRLGAAVARGLQGGGIAATIKHFPGHGATAFDTHLRAARLDSDEATLRARDILPFRACAPDAAAIMAAHVAVPAIDGDRPASISARFLTGILRDEWHYEGVCFTDCMQMDAIAKGIGSVQGVIEAIAAGADCALVSHDPDLAFEAAQQLARAVDRGDVSLQRLEQAYDRVMRLRARAQAPLDLDAPAPYPGIGRRIAREAVTLVRGEARGDALADRAIIFGDGSLIAHAPALDEQRLALDPDDDEVRAMLVALRASSRRAVVLAYRAHIYPRQAAAIDAVLAQAPDALVVSTGEPYDIPLFGRARHVLATYGNDDVSLAGLSDVVFLGAPCTGVLPVALD
jgi:beta-N-acetylhexosaminidase